MGEDREIMPLLLLLSLDKVVAIQSQYHNFSYLTIQVQ